MVVVLRGEQLMNRRLKVLAVLNLFFLLFSVIVGVVKCSGIK